MTTTETPKLTRTIKCRRCDGTGVWSWDQRVPHCFACDGSGKREVWTKAGKAAHEERQARHAAVYARCEELDAKLPRRERHWVWDFQRIEAEEPERYAAALAKVVL